MIAHLMLATVATIAAEDSGTAGVALRQSPEYAIGWGTLALINAGLAQSKNRSGLNWFLLSLPFGPLATFLLVGFCEKLPAPDAKPGKLATATEPSR